MGVWKLIDTPGSKEFSLTRSIEGEKVTLMCSTDALADQAEDFNEEEEEVTIRFARLVMILYKTICTSVRHYAC